MGRGSRIWPVFVIQDFSILKLWVMCSKEREGRPCLYSWVEEWEGSSLSYWHHPRSKAENPGGQGYAGKVCDWVKALFPLQRRGWSLFPWDSKKGFVKPKRREEQREHTPKTLDLGKPLTILSLSPCFLGSIATSRWGLIVSAGRRSASWGGREDEFAAGNSLRAVPPGVFTGPVLSLFLFQGPEDSRPLTSNSGIHRMGLQMSLHLGLWDLSVARGSLVPNWCVGCTDNLGQFSSAVLLAPQKGSLRPQQPGD